MIKKIKVELLILSFLLLSIFFAHNIDIWINNFFKDFNNFFQNIYLKEFFIRITVLGDSIWYFLISLCVIVLGLLLRGNNRWHKYKKIIDIKISFYIFLLFSLLVTGIITQLLKHIVGRPRPNYSTLDQYIGFEFFNLSSEFHSFPSGHTSTIFAVALTVSYFLPKTKYFVLFFALIIAFSRIIVGAHFFTDIIGGVVVAYLGIKITKLLLNKFNFINITKTKNEITYLITHQLYYSYAVFFCLVVLISVGPSIDIYLSSLFYNGKGQFLLQSYYDITIFIRKIILRVVIAYILILPIISLWLPIRQLYFNYKFNLKNIIFLWASSLFNLLIIVNLFFKNLWGRARPGDIIQLGGKESFTPWYQISDACNSNCSFVSGDAAVGFSLIVFYFIIKKEIFFWLSVVFGSLFGLVRIMEGGHFLSDVIMSAAIIYTAYYFQTKYFYIKND